MNIAEYVYYAGYRLSQKRGLRKQRQLPHKTISVGNLTLGGTGKTPLVIALAEEAKKLGYSPCILTRGYKGKAKTPIFVSKGNGPLIDYRQSGDEPYLMAQRLKGVEIIKGARRYEAGLMSERANLFIIDDGFQHWRLKRDIDVVLVDSVSGFGNGRLFPMGPLREPITELKRASVIVLTKSASNEKASKDDLYRLDNTDSLRNIKITDQIYKASHRAAYLITPHGEKLPPTMLSGKDVYAFCGIAHPQSFLNSLKAHGADVIKLRTFRDHYDYKASDIKSIIDEARSLAAEAVITTEKDLIKLRDANIKNLFALGIDFIIDEEFYKKILIDIAHYSGPHCQDHFLVDLRYSPLRGYLVC
ncbi:tetraacyldisaccharide 4'-kinase [Candidatus Magnetomonas plexicatena]|uniref:tetraacyldisaccharide 4'-kinase n=1 Tax=Candidatus Magnetomonas plexicatena TaxID=2552947 RepID=UPI001C789BF2|nr:tetraacyldisaccharide 4'-kinase [Nitrospirales bacterium LBB_01]